MSEFTAKQLLPPKFNGTDKPINFLQWKDTIETYIASMNGDLLNELLLPRPAPIVPVPVVGAGRVRVAAAAAVVPVIPDDDVHLYQQEGYESTGQKKAMIAGVLKSSLDITLAGEFIDPAISREPRIIWQTLNNRYDRDTEGSKQDLQIELHNARMKRGESIDTHIARLNSIWSRMGTKGEAPTNSTKVYNLLNLLSDDYSDYAATLKTRADDLSIERMIQLLKDRCDELERQKRVGDRREEQKEVAHIAQGEKGKHNAEVAAFVGRGRGGRGGGKWRGNDRRDNNRREQHPYTRNERHEKREGGTNNNNNFICYNCYQTGHTTSVCKNKMVCKHCRKEGHRVSECPFAPTHNYNRGGSSSRGRGFNPKQFTPRGGQGQ